VVKKGLKKKVQGICFTGWKECEAWSAGSDRGPEGKYPHKEAGAQRPRLKGNIRGHTKRKKKKKKKKNPDEASN